MIQLAHDLWVKPDQITVIHQDLQGNCWVSILDVEEPLYVEKQAEEILEEMRQDG